MTKKPNARTVERDFLEIEGGALASSSLQMERKEGGVIAVSCIGMDAAAGIDLSPEDVRVLIEWLSAS